MVDVAIQQILQALIGVLLSMILAMITAAAPALIVLAKAWVENKVEQARARLSAEQLYLIDLIVERAVQFAEQSDAIGQLLAEGKTKKEAALDFIQSEFDRLGIPFNVDDAAARIEAAVNQGLQKKAEPGVIQAARILPL